MLLSGVDCMNLYYFREQDMSISVLKIKVCFSERDSFDNKQKPQNASNRMKNRHAVHQISENTVVHHSDRFLKELGEASIPKINLRSLLLNFLRISQL